MRVIDLYKNIANNEELPEKIKIRGYDYMFTLREDCAGYKWYGDERTGDDFGEAINRNLEFILKQEVEIIEEDKPIEKLGRADWEFHKQKDKINELVDKVNELERERKKNEYK